MKISKIMAILFLQIVIGACNVNGANFELEGQYYYGGQGIYTLDLKSGESQHIYNMPNSLVNNLTKVTDKEIIFDIQNLKEPLAPTKIVVFDLKELEINEILLGSMPVYIYSHRKIIFYRGNKLYVANLEDPVSSTKEIYEFSGSVLESAVQVSDDEIIFESNDEAAYGIRKYNIATGDIERLTTLNSCSIHNSFWRNETNQLFCEERAQDGSYTGIKYLIGLDGNSKLPMSLEKQVSWWPVAYLADRDYMLFQKRTAGFLGMSENHPVWIYDFESGKKQQLADDMLLGSGGVIIRK